MLRLFKKNKKTVFNELYQAYSEQLFLLILRYVVSQFDAEEVLQRGFIKVYENLDRCHFENEKASLGWLNKIMVNESLLFLREQKRLTLSDELEFNDGSIFLVPEIEVKLELEALLGMNFNHKQNSAIRIAARYQLKAFGQADLNNTRSVKYNGFLDAIMDVNIGKDYKREEWVGAGFGYLIHQEGNVYGENTARVFLKYRSSKMWGVQPEFNYSFKDNNGFIGLGVYFSL